MSDPFDDWLQMNPDDREPCEHGRVKPCWQCVQERMDEIENSKREEKRGSL